MTDDPSATRAAADPAAVDVAAGEPVVESVPLLQPDEHGLGVSAAHRATAMSVADKVRFVLRGVGQTLVTAGLVVLLFVVYEVYVTNWFAERAQEKVHTALEQQWLNLPSSTLSVAGGSGFANLYIPRLGSDFAWTIVEGTADADLEKGPGHYAETQLPGQAGDFAIAGHRVGKGEPFLNLDHVQAGDQVVVETKTTWFVYCVIGAGRGNATCDPGAKGASLANPGPNGVPGQEIVDPTDGAAVLPVPNDPTARAPYTTAYLTMTTCHPKFTATQRLIVHAVLDPLYPKGIAKADVGTLKALYVKVGS